MAFITVRTDTDNGTGELVLHEGFKELPTMMRLDVLQDVMYEVVGSYNDARKEFNWSSDITVTSKTDIQDMHNINVEIMKLALPFAEHSARLREFMKKYPDLVKMAEE